ncbi:hypothetical protein QTP86_019495 [Hemibagrus guttatus]|nr:hypothetical protein QTP86_019495 [Hemibagrus guttatus]
MAAFGAELSSEACRELGFSSNLLCSSCDLLGQFSLTQLEPFCRQCCQQEAQLESRKVDTSTSTPEPSSRSVDENWGGSLKSKLSSGATSQRCSGAFRLSYQHYTVHKVRRRLFIMFGRCFQSQYVRGSDPVLKLLDDNGNIAEELSILKWNTDSVEEFLSEKLERI